MSDNNVVSMREWSTKRGFITVRRRIDGVISQLERAGLNPAVVQSLVEWADATIRQELGVAGMAIALRTEAVEEAGTLIRIGNGVSRVQLLPADAPTGISWSEPDYAASELTVAADTDHFTIRVRAATKEEMQRYLKRFPLPMGPDAIMASRVVVEQFKVWINHFTDINEKVSLPQLMGVVNAMFSLNCSPDIVAVEYQAMAQAGIWAVTFFDGAEVIECTFNLSHLIATQQAFQERVRKMREQCEGDAPHEATPQHP